MEVFAAQFGSSNRVLLQQWLYVDASGAGLHKEGVCGQREIRCKFQSDS
jgi:hypothetical protein